MKSVAQFFFKSFIRMNLKQNQHLKLDAFGRTLECFGHTLEYVGHTLECFGVRLDDLG